MALPLDGTVVIEVGASVGAAFCGKQLAELGARVIAVEPPGGGATRTGPTAPDGGPETAARHLFLDMGKESLVLDASLAADRRRIAALIDAADVVLHSLAPDGAAGLGLQPWQVEVDRPSLIVASVTPFGMDGPWANQPGTELTVSAQSSYMYITGDPDKMPLGPFAHQLEHAGGAVATIGVLAALAGRERDGHGEYVDVALIEVGTATLDAYVIGGYSWLGRNRGRLGNLIGPYDIFKTKDGFLHVASLSNQHWQGLALAAGKPELVDDPRLNTPIKRLENPDLIADVLREWSASLTSVELLDALQEMRVPSAISESMGDLMKDPQIEARGFLRDLDHPRAGTLRYPAQPFLSDSIELRLERAPLLDEHQPDAERLPAKTASPTGSRQARPLDGVRVVDLTQVWAAPFATTLLAELGADVMHIEAPSRPDMTRLWTVNLEFDAPPWERSAYYNQHNRGGKRSLILNLANEQARDVLRDLVSKSDVLINNFTARVMGNWGFAYDEMLKANPRLVYVTMPSYGATGPYRDYVGFGEALEGACGMVRGRGYGPERPIRSGSAMSDPYAAFAAATLILAALRQRDRYGVPSYFDLSQRDAAVRLVGDELLAYQLTGEEPQQWWNRDREWAPHNAFRCAGDDRWVTIAVRSDSEWRALCDAIYRPDLRDDESLATAQGRRDQLARIEEAIGGFCANREAAFVETMLLRAGVPAAYVRAPWETVAHPQYNHRGFFPWTDHPFAGPRRLHASPVLLRRRPATRTNRRAPLFDEHTRAILREVGGYSKERIDELEAAGAAGGVPGITADMLIAT